MDIRDILLSDPVTYFSPMTTRVSVQSVAARGPEVLGVFPRLHFKMNPYL